MGQFLSDVVHGLSQERKSLSSMYFYDAEGSRIFQEIMEMPEYYLTRAEFEILTQQARKIGLALGFASRFNVVELGAGDGTKTLAFLRELQSAGMGFQYLPIDVSASVLDDLQLRMHSMGLKVDTRPLVGDYFECLKEVPRSVPTLFLFLGANIGNYSHLQCLELLRGIGRQMQPGDHLLIGFDLQKNPLTVHGAYFDPHGITKRFNLNLLARINRELGANFLLDQWDFYCQYNPDNGEIRSYLVSLKPQTVYISAANKEFSFGRHELIFTELSRKYSLQEIAGLAAEAGFMVADNFFDCQHYFVDSLWRLA